MSPYVYENLIAEGTGWSLSDIRNMDIKDFRIHLNICITKRVVDQEFQIMLVGGGSEPQKKNLSVKEIMAKRNKEQISGANTEPLSGKVMKFDSTIRKVRIPKEN